MRLAFLALVTGKIETGIPALVIETGIPALLTGKIETGIPALVTSKIETGIPALVTGKIETDIPVTGRIGAGDRGVVHSFFKKYSRSGKKTQQQQRNTKQISHLVRVVTRKF